MSAQQSSGVITIGYQLVQIVPGKTPINIAQYVDTSKHSIQTLAGGKILSEMIFEMELPELSVYYQKPKSTGDVVG